MVDEIEVSELVYKRTQLKADEDELKHHIEYYSAKLACVSEELHAIDTKLINEYYKRMATSLGERFK